MIEGHYRLSAPLAWRELDGQWLVYQPRSGQMMTLDTVAAVLVSLLEAGPASPEELVAHLAVHTDLAADASMADAVQAALGPLCEVGLVVGSDHDLSW